MTARAAPRFYGTDLAAIHDAGFGEAAARAAPFLVALLRRAGFRSGLVVDAGCGSGILSRALVDAGYDVLGVDASPAMVRLARRAAPGARFRVAEISETPFPRCAGVFAVGEVVSYGGPSRARLARFLRRARGALVPGGVLAFDFLVPLQGGERVALRRREGGGWSVVSETTEDAGGASVTRRITSVRRVAGRDRVAHEVHRVRIDSAPAMLAALEREGFEARVSPGYGRYRLGRGHAVVLARRPA